MIKKLKCHCGNVEAEVNIPDNGIEKIMRCISLFFQFHCQECLLQLLHFHSGILIFLSLFFPI